MYLILKYIIFDEVWIEIMRYLETKIYAIKVKATVHGAMSDFTFKISVTD